MSDLLMSKGAAEWPALLNRIQKESDLIVSYEGIPMIMTEAEFKDLYKDIESVAYHEMLSFIEAQIDKAALHAGP